MARPRKTNVHRDASGKSRGEVFDPSAIYAQPHRRDCADPGSPDAGSPLGRLRMSRLISDEQYHAGSEWGLAVLAYCRVMGIRSGSPSGGSLASCQSGSGFYSWEGDRVEIDEDEAAKRVQRVKGRYNACFDAVTDVSRTLSRGNKIHRVLKDVCILEMDERALWASSEMLGDLRVGLNTVGKVLRDDRRRS